MSEKNIYEVKRILKKICGEYGNRLTGSIKNKQLEGYTKTYFEKNGYKVELQGFSCIDWKEQGVEFF